MPTKGDEASVTTSTDVILYGIGRYGRRLAAELSARGLEVLAVDWDPQARGRLLDDDRIEVVFGDADDPEFPGTLPLTEARVVVSTIPDLASNAALVAALRRWGFGGSTVVTAHTRADAAAMADLDVDLVLEPFEDAGEMAAERLLASVRRTRSESEEHQG